jgi:hypothetical protein
MKKIFKYIEPIWLGRNGKISIRSTLAIGFSWNFMWNLSHAVAKWDDGRSMSDLALVLGIEAGLIASLLALRTYQNVQNDSRFGAYGSPYNNNQNNNDCQRGSESVGTN